MNYIIACAGGFGREIFHSLSLLLHQENNLEEKSNTTISFIDDNLQALENYGNRYPKIISTIVTYKPNRNELVFIAAGTPQSRWKITKLLQKTKCSFTTIIHPNAIVSQNVSIEQGSNIGWGTLVGSDVTIGQFVSLNCNICIGHDVIIEDYVEVGPGSVINGFCYIEEGVHIASNCTIAPGVRVGAWSKISANTAVMRDVPPYSYVIEVPGTVHKDFFQHPE
jgi:sugar O-acyltransferase (sialic acid O-acetyltransferase NeuD family)